MGEIIFIDDDPQRANDEVINVHRPVELEEKNCSYDSWKEEEKFRPKWLPCRQFASVFFVEKRRDRGRRG